MSVAVKICGLRDAEAAHAAARGGADALGFVFFEKSPRHLSLEAARRLAPDLPAGPRRVGVMVDADLATIRAFADALQLDMVQLHGRETPLFAARVKAELGLAVMKVIAVETDDDLTRAREFEHVADALLFDAKPPKGAVLPGGNAHAFPWSLMAGFRSRLPWFLAGGLTPDNVQRAIAQAHAEGVDVSSGVEDGPGIKSLPRIEAFLSAVKDAKTGDVSEE